MGADDKLRKVVIVGAGPVGCLAAMALAKQGWAVDVYEGRPDIRLPASKAAAQQRSINLAMSSRGIAALEAIDPNVSTRFLQTVIPMRGRMIHDMQGKETSQLYDRDGQCINSIDRALLNEDLLTEALRASNVRVFFRHRVTAVDFERRVMVVNDQDENRTHEVEFDLCIGTDGSYSVVRRQMMRVVRMDFEQMYIPHEYLELKMKPGRDPEGKPTFLIDPNHLHIWPRHSFMLIALPNKDKTFTCTLFAPTAEFEQLNSRETILSWFGKHFPDALGLIGADSVLDSFQRNPRSSLITIKANPYHYKDRGIILGDAAHSMVPFYGQGLNCGLEDVRVLHVLLQQEGVDPSLPDAGLRTRLARALSRYSETRREDLLAIQKLAMDNYVEMRHAVTTPTYLFRRAVDKFLFSISSPKPVTLKSLGPLLARVSFPSAKPQGWLPLYTMVTFRPDISYATAKKKSEQQSALISTLGYLGTGVIGVASISLAWMAYGYYAVRRGLSS
ncbi:FAD/NAD-P-binding domain-containing protein [Vararia minispora EC-137]|uniref:FAD/NAD-P-binding domain-containing protein n=1 Tax=Vararia minispora EC-137 TaxID=1314806 RepID=A0ACB8QV24_9AGAM|nr:FAD/NAD-P-binding domain-containing protein [Vararia minispora EC-137]